MITEDLTLIPTGCPEQESRAELPPFFQYHNEKACNFALFRYHNQEG